MIVQKGPRKFQLLSRKTGRALGTHPSYAAALRQERAIKASQARAARRNPKINKPHPLDEPRIRFNWGYHDGASDVRNNRRKSDKWLSTHHDKIYLQGYRAGVSDMRNSEYFENSDIAWKNRRKLNDRSFYNPSSFSYKDLPMEMYWVLIPDKLTYQEATSLAEAREIVAVWKKEKDVELLRIVDAYDYTNTVNGGYRLIAEWRRDSSGKWKQRAGTGRVLK